MRKYDHLERLGGDCVEGILDGECYIFPKIDGTNARVWLKDGEVCFGSRTRRLSEEQDNHGFRAWGVGVQGVFRDILQSLEIAFESPVVVYGEWLVPHSLKTYREEAWRKFYVFDVWSECTGRYLHYSDWNKQLKGWGEFDIIPPLATGSDLSEQQLDKLLQENTYLIPDTCGIGEGIVIKNYDWVNQFGKQPWAKLVRNEFKEKNREEFGAKKVSGATAIVERRIANAAVTQALVDKERAKIGDVDRNILIPRLLGTVMYCVITEELWDQIKKHKMPTINFSTLTRYVNARVKEFAQDLF